MRVRGIEVRDRLAGADRLILRNVDSRDLPGHARGDRHDVGADLRVVGHFLPGREQRVDNVDEQQRHYGAAEDEIEAFRLRGADGRLVLGDLRHRAGSRFGGRHLHLHMMDIGPGVLWCPQEEDERKDAEEQDS